MGVQPLQEASKLAYATAPGALPAGLAPLPALSIADWTRVEVVADGNILPTREDPLDFENWYPEGNAVYRLPAADALMHVNDASLAERISSIGDLEFNCGEVYYEAFRQQEIRE